jgi:CubicO group peptidase (beta-lactamase class C family)
VVAAFAGADTVVQGRGTTGHGSAPPGADTVFQIGSVTKVFTALALADAVVRAELSLHTPLSAYLPEAGRPGRTADISLVHLATHTSGLPRLPGGLRQKARHNRLDPYRGLGTEDLLAALATARPRPAPGTKVRYSNFGAGLLGEALSRHAGLSYDRLVAARITGPLGLSDTVVRLRPHHLERRAGGHDGRRRPVPDWDLGALPGAGALYSTARDLLIFARAHLHPETTPLAAALRLVQEPRVKANRWIGLGLGWHTVPVRGTAHTALWHNGGTGGFSSYLAILPKADAGVVVLANTARPVDPIGFKVLQSLAKAAVMPTR